MGHPQDRCSRSLRIIDAAVRRDVAVANDPFEPNDSPPV